MNDQNDLRNRNVDTLREIRVMENWLELRLARAHSVIIGTKDHAVHEALSEVKVRFEAIRDAAIAALEAGRSGEAQCNAPECLMGSEGHDWTVLDCPHCQRCVKYCRKGIDSKAAYRDLSAENARLRAEVAALKAAAPQQPPPVRVELDTVREIVAKYVGRTSRTYLYILSDLTKALPAALSQQEAAPSVSCNCKVAAGLASFHADDCRAMTAAPSVCRKPCHMEPGSCTCEKYPAPVSEPAASGWVNMIYDPVQQGFVRK